jgi:hypothetical protein
MTIVKPTQCIQFVPVPRGGIVPPWLEKDGYERVLPAAIRRIETATQLAEAAVTR